MFLQNFYKESDTHDRRRRIIISLVFFAAVAYIALIINLCSNQPTQKDIEQSINNSPALRDLERFCQNIPKPQNLKYQFKQIYGSTRTTNIGYWYGSDSPFSEVRDFYANYFEKEGWTLENLWNEKSALPRLLKYRKGKRTISVEQVTNPNANYALSCSIDQPYPSI